ncbi:S8 family serine peptidase [Streptomyces rimosus]|uniref:S8 family serine peptidase n=1 Tax=Streptomyces rimosus TaxID=1927 RepID=UPI0004C6D686|nr:S8 family serine peptidase [Streptomyces rimosus]
MRVARTLRAGTGVALTGALLLAAGGTAQADEVRSKQWPLEAFGAKDIWKQATGKGVTVALVETGIRASHQDLTGQFVPGKDFTQGVDVSRALKPGQDIRDHGTAMAGIIAGHGHGAGGAQGVKGLAPGAKIMPLTAYKNESQATRYAADHGADIINMSYVVTRDADTCESIRYALDKGVIVVAGVGNDGAAKKNYPAACPGVIGVGAVNEYGEVWNRSNYNDTVDLLAPGDGIPFAQGKSDSAYTVSGGTSAATAYASAAAALLREKFPDLTPGQIANRLVKTAGLAKPEKAKNLKLPDAHYGYGFIQPAAALSRDIPAGPAEGPLPMPQGKAAQPAGDTGADKGQQSASSADTSKWLVIGGGALAAVVVVGVVIALVVSRRRGRSSSQAWS